ncbi:MAG: DUF1129 family protein [Clostridia bacterium]|nr:DUF1129 family protein [Clostridia bacterium]
MKTDTSKLNTENRTLLHDMKSYLSEKRINRSDYRRVCGDITLMLYDAQERGESAESLFPEGYRKFLDDVASNCSKEKWYETLLTVLTCALAMLTVMTLFLTLNTHLEPVDGEYVSGVMASFTLSSFVGSSVAGCIGSTVVIFHHVFSFEKKRYYYVSVVGLFIVAFVAAFLVSLLFRNAFITVNWVALACASAGAAVLLWAVKWGISKLNSKK